MSQGEPGIELDTSLGYKRKAAASALHSAMEAVLRPLGMTITHYSCLELLAQRPGLSNSELARGAFVTRQSMNVLLQALEREGLVVRPAQAPAGRALPTVGWGGVGWPGGGVGWAVPPRHCGGPTGNGGESPHAHRPQPGSRRVFCGGIRQGAWGAGAPQAGGSPGGHPPGETNASACRRSPCRLPRRSSAIGHRCRWSSRQPCRFRPRRCPRGRRSCSGCCRRGRTPGRRPRPASC